jgi:excisionase family DNA binding protein
MLTVSEVANRLGLKPATVRLWIAQRKVGHCKLGRSIRVPIEEVERLIRESLIPARERRRG